MCGICGIVDPNGRLGPIAAMNGMLRRRGPDDEGYLFAEAGTGRWQLAGGTDSQPELNLISYQAVPTDSFDLALGSRRLAILDLSAAGHMPMAYAGGALWLVHNGEVYNYRELRQELISCGYEFRSDTDTEVILAAYAEWGVDCLSRFNGMFAFALWDAPRRRLFCARDRFGIKPFYYHWDGASLFFASEIKALLQHPAVPRMPNDAAVFDYLALGLSDHGQETFFASIHNLPPAHFLLLDLANSELNLRRWWQAHINPQIGNSHDDPSVYHHFAELLEDAVRLRLRSDVPVGSCLSGGLDSSAVVTLANGILRHEEVIPPHLVGDHQKTFTARNTQPEIDEYQFSHRIVRQTGAEENLVVPSGERLWQEVAAFVWQMDEPVDSTSQYPQWNVMRLARSRGVTVLLDGQGGDEILAGYYAYYPHYVSQIRQQQGLLAAIQASWQVSRVGGGPAREMLLRQAVHRLPWRLRQVATWLRPERGAPGQGGTGLTEWQLSADFVEAFWDRRWQPAGPVGADGLVGILYRDLTATNLPKLLRYEDRNSMAFSLETRLPFLDFRLVEYVFSLPLNYRIRHGWSKWLLRRALSDRLPREIAWRRSKLGFPTPEREWLRTGGSFIRELLGDHAGGAISQYANGDALRRMAALPDDELAATPGVWRLVNLTLWLDLFFEAAGQAAQPAPPVVWVSATAV